MKENNFDSMFWHKGEGMQRRCHNIDTIKELIQKGFSYQQIFKLSRKFFTTKIFNEYYDIAIDEIKNPIEINEESFSPKQQAEQIIKELENEEK